MDEKQGLLLLLGSQDNALEQIMRRSVHGATLDVNSARKALAEIYKIARECRNVEGE